LEDIEPPIWRRLLVPADVTLPALHDILQAAMGWLDCHLHQFVIGDTRYIEPDPDELHGEPEDKDERRVKLGSVVKSVGAAFLYEYDFGDGWAHEIRLEKIEPTQEGVVYPACIGGARACPPEDCGGPPGYMRLLKALARPTDPRHRELVEWAGEDFDPEEINMPAVNADLAAMRRRPRRR